MASLSNGKCARLAEPRNPFNLFFVTDRRFFEFLKGRNYNVALQNNDAMTDGSLSVYFARRKIPHVNVEARLGSLSEQIEMLRVMREMLDEAGLAPASVEH